MKKFQLLFLLASVAFRAASAEESLLHSIEGTFRGIKNGVVSIEARPDIGLRIQQDDNVKIISPAGPFSWDWLLPGDGIRVIVSKNGKAAAVEAFPTWTFGTVAFVSPDRLTLLEGPQFFLNHAPVFLNGEQIENLSVLKPPNEVLVRFDSLNKKTVGIWAFDRSDDFKESSGTLQNLSSISASLEADHLRVNVRTKASGKLWMQLLGATQTIRLPEKEPGHYQTVIPIPAGVNLPRSYLAFEWVGSGVDETWISSKPVSFYMESPRVITLGPANGSLVPNNPPFVFVNFDPGHSPLDLSSVRLMFDGKNVTNETYVDANLVFYAPSILASGRHECSLSGRAPGGRGGFHLTWSFRVGDASRREVSPP